MPRNALNNQLSNFLVSLSFANLVYLRAWADLYPFKPDELFHRKILPGIATYFAIAGDVLALSLLTFLLIYFASKLPGWVQRTLLAAAVAMVLLAINSLATFSLRTGPLHPILAAVWVVSAAFIFFKFSAAVPLIRGIAQAAIPCLAVTFAGSLIDLHVRTPLPPDPPLAPRLAGAPPVRVLWILFDEWDQRLSFTDRAPGMRLPVLDRLARHSFAANHADAVQAGIPVYQMATNAAIPALLYGKHLAGSEIADPGTMRLDFADGSSAVFGSGGDIFSRMRSRGWNSAAVGWFLPYCRAFADQLSDCYWEEMYEQRSSSGHTFPEAAIDETRMLFETGMTSVFGPSLPSVRHQAMYQALLAAARRDVADPSIGFAFIHLNVPHVPYFYDPKLGRFAHYGYSEALYNVALQWVDRAVGDILSSLNQAGLDSKTAIILSADHPLRNSSRDPYVPFIVHLPGEEEGLISTTEFSTVKSADLALAIAGGEVKSLPEVMNLLGISGR